MDSRVNCRGMCFSLVLVALACIGSTESLKCYTCSNVSHISNCLTVMICSADEECYTEAYGTGNNTAYNLGCRTFLQCHGSSTTNLPISIVGRDVASSGPPITCSGCCAVDSCNDKLCTRASEVFVPTNGQCHDDPDYNCELVSGLFDVCKDIQHAKIACRKWCGLCQLVDGSWSSWLGWSACDVTCGNGHRSRSRSCTEPKPSHGGLDCVGQTVDTSNCTAITCPVNGSWSPWSPWGECSVICGMGLQRRDRSCSNPFPGPSGNHCFGDSRDDRVCFLKPCIDGQWSNWAPWGSCSATCDRGLQSRYRQCDNPKPSQFGKQCDGNNEDYSACNIHGCPVNGSWSNWLGWSACDLTCGDGQRSRSRSCTAPKPSHGGLDCVGRTVDTSNCTTITCPVHGGWSTWSPWGECSVTCGMGLQRRDRSCSNPFPGPSGNHCFGDSRADRVCFLRPCIDGQWSNWTPWGSCSATCDGGLQSRYRQCNNPKPSQFGKQCDGNNEDYSACNIHGCPAPVVIFSVHTPSSITVGGSTIVGYLKFTQVLSNIGKGYSTTSGAFTCTIPGTYQFSVSFLSTYFSSCQIKHNDQNTVNAYHPSNHVYQSATSSMYIYLTNSDTVKVYCDGYQFISKDSNTMFSGALIAQA